MKTKIPVPQVILVVAAILIGVLLDRLLFAREATPARGPARAETTSANAGTSGATTSTRASTTAAAGEQQSATVSHSEARKSLDAILATKDPRQRTRDLQAYIDGLTAGEFPDALKRIRQMTSSNERELASRLLVAQWVQSDPDGALQFAAGNRGFEYLAEDVFQQQGANDFQSAMTRAQQIPGNDLRYRALRGVLRSKADTDPAGAIQLAQGLGEFRGSEPLANAIYRQWAANDPTAAAAHAAQQDQQGGWRSPVLQVVNTWAEQDPVAAANWSLSLPNSDAQARSLSQVMRDWGRNDPTSTANWIHSLPTGSQRDTAVAGFAQSMVAADPQTALGWIGTMSDEAAKQRTLQRMSREVMWRDPQNGPAMLQAAGLSPEQIPQPDRGRGGRGRGPGGPPQP